MNKVPKVCKDNEELNPLTRRCRKKCNENQFRHEKTGRCKKIASRKSSPKKSSPKTLLVICSNNSGHDFPKDKNQNMLKQLLGDDFISEFMGQYPEDLPNDKKYDAVLFAGCNLLIWLFNKNYEVGMEKLSNILKQDGIIIFVESQRYIDKVVTKGKSYGLSIPLEEMKLYGVTKNDNNGIKQDILKSWEKFFQLDLIDNYFVYKKL